MCISCRHHGNQNSLGHCTRSDLQIGPSHIWHFHATSKYVLLAHATCEHADWSQNLTAAPRYAHQVSYHTCVTSMTSLSCPPFMSAHDFHVTSTPDLCCALLCAGEYTAIIGHGKGPSAGLASSIKHDLRARRGVSRISSRALCWLLCGDMNHRCLSVWKQPCRYSGFRVGCLVSFVLSRPAGLPG